MKKNTYIFSHYIHKGLGWGLKAIVDMSAKNVFFLDGSPRLEENE